MKGVFISNACQLEVREIPEPKADKNLVLAQVLRCGICGSDISMWHTGGPFIGILLGHEYCLKVLDPGNSNFKVGDRVVGLPTGACLECDFCKNGYYNICPEKRPGGKGVPPPGTGGNGAFAKYILIRGKTLYKIGDNVSDDAAALAEPVSCGISVVDRFITPAGPGDKVLVAGGGVVGTMVCESLRDRKVSYIGLLENNPIRAAQALHKGLADEIFDVTDETITQKLKAAGGELGFDKAVECTGKGQPFKLMAAVLKRRGELVQAGISVKDVEINNWVITDKELYVIGAFASTVSAFEKAIDALNKDPQRYERHITFPSFSLDDVQKAFESTDNPNNPSLKLMVDPNK
jgi:L-iditol 2-dehydrogenase